ncbi:MAG: hypothetical protein NC124_15645 [Clostridium sp.]|nr:hypothetical protein [Clostridium sp.]
MMKELIADYVRAYNWNSYEKQWRDNFPDNFVLFWVSCMFCGAIHARADLSVSYYIVAAALFLSMGFVLVSGQCHPVKLGKMMYLCPMDADRRRAYIYASYFFRVVLHVVVIAVSTMILIPFSYCDMVSAVEILLNGLVISVLLPPGKEENVNLKRGIMLGVAIASNVFQAGIILDDKPDVIPKLIILGLLLFVQLPLSVSYCKWVKKQLKAAINYEEN